MKTVSLIALFCWLALTGQAQTRVVLLRDTTRLGLPLPELTMKYPPALARKPGEKGLFAQQPKRFIDSLTRATRQLVQFAETNKKRLPVPGIILQTREFVNPDGTYAWVFCSFPTPELTARQEEQLLDVLQEYYGKNRFPLRTSTGFRWESVLQVGQVPDRRTVRRGAGIISTLEAAGQTSRPDTVTMLAFNQLNLRTIPAVVYRFPKLKELDLSKNSLTALPARLTADIPSLQRLSVLYNAIPDDSVFMTPNKHLISLNQQGNKLTRIHASLRQNKRLESLWMGNNQLVSLDVRLLKSLHRLNDLNLYNAGLTQLPRQIRRLKHIRVLDLYYNKFTQLPRQISRMKRLEQLALSHNDLTELPASLARLRRLQVLFAHHNRISQLPADFARLGRLRVLALSYNWITVAPPVLAALPALEELDLSNNNLQEFPTVLTQIRSLRKVYLSSNPMFGTEAMKSPYAGQIRELQAKNKEVFY